MARRRQREQTIFFPWERGGGILRGRGLARAKLAGIVLTVALVLGIIGAHERRKTGVRSTEATISVVRTAIDAYRSDHERKCPASLDVLKTERYLGIDPVDAWGRPLRLFCPGRKDMEGYDLTSDGPDGEVDGLDRVE